MRLALIALVAAATALAGCKTIKAFRDDPIANKGVAAPAAKDCSHGGVGCPPADRRQYYDDKSARYYYFDPSTGRYYWENGEPRF
jgi:hypothetical protein